jgi:rRNA maturation protein Nop10
MPKRKPIRPLLAKCPQCGSEPGIKCVEQGFVLETVHPPRFAMARLQQTPAPRDPDVDILMVACPHCGAPPRRVCSGPPPARDPKPYHKARWLAKEKLDNAIRQSRGKPPKSYGKPWLEDHQKPNVQPLNRYELRAIREERDGEGDLPTA